MNYLIEIQTPGTLQGRRTLQALVGIARDMPGCKVNTMQAAATCRLVVTLGGRDHAAANGRVIDFIDGAHAVAGANGCHREIRTRSKPV